MTIAVRLLYVLAVLPVISTVLQVRLHMIESLAVPLAVVSLLLTVLLARYVGRGKNVARIMVWVFTALETFNVASFALLTASRGPADRPGWWVPFVLAQDALQVAILIAASVLLALPAARAHFWHRPPVVTARPQPTDGHPKSAPRL